MAEKPGKTGLLLAGKICLATKQVLSEGLVSEKVWFSLPKGIAQ